MLPNFHFVIQKMVSNSNMNKLFAISCLSWLVSVFFNTSVGQGVPFKAANLGAWLVAEGWMTPNLFDGIPNKDLLDGTQVQLKSTMLNKFLSAENGGGTNLVANRGSASGWETFRLWRINENTFNLRVFNKQFVGLGNQGQGKNIVAVSTTAGNAETFQIAQSGSSVVADYNGDNADWGDQNPSVFQMTIVNTLRGEYQLTNGYGPDKAPQVLKDHWSSYIVEDDFKFMSDNGLNAVRIPVGWWIKYGQTPPAPFVGGSLQVLDNAFSWAQKYNMKVIVDLHAVPGSQNGNDHSGTRDGFAEWGDSHVQETVDVIDFLAQRYANRPSLGAIELMNEPNAQFVLLPTLSNYYQKGYDAVRKYTPSAYVILSNRLGDAPNKELLSLAGGLDRSVIDVHYYNLYSDQFKNMNVQQNIDYIRNTRAAQLQEVTQSNGRPLSFVGEWTAALANDFQDMEVYRRYAQAQTDVYGKATFGWAYWSYKCEPCGMWSLRRMILQGLINLKNP